MTAEPQDAAASAALYYYDEAAAQAAVDFFRRYLCLTKGKWAKKPFILAGWQEDDIIRPAFGWKRADGTRRYRRVVVFIARKNGKTELAAGVGLLLLVGDAEYGAEVYAIAKDRDQARIVFDKAGLMVGMSADLATHIQVYKTSIFAPELMASFKPLTGNAEGKHGVNASGLIGDEVHEWRDAALYTTIHQSEGAREQPLEFLISTAGIRNKGYGWELWEEVQAIRSGTVPQDDTLVVVYAAAAEDDWTDETVWAKANPNLGVSVSLDYLRAECAKARRSPRLENDFRRYHLNQWTSQAVRWLSLKEWDACAGLGFRQLADESSLVGRRCRLGVDLAQTSDINALVYLFAPDDLDDGRYDVVCRFFVPEAKIEQRKRDRVPYDVWAAQGHLITTPGNVTDYERIIAQIEADGEKFDIEQIGIDRWNSSHFIQRLVDRGFAEDRIVLVGQGYGSMSESAKMLERLVLSRRFDHAGHPVLRWMAENVAITQDSAGNIKPAKDKSTEKIDGISATIDALFCWLNGGASGPSLDDYLSTADASDEVAA